MKRNKGSAMRDICTSLRNLRFGRGHMIKPRFGIVIAWKFPSAPSAVQVRIIFCDDFQAHNCIAQSHLSIIEIQFPVFSVNDAANQPPMWANEIQWFSSWWWIFTAGEKKSTFIIAKTAFSQIIILHRKRRHQSNPIRSGVRSGIRSLFC